MQTDDDAVESALSRFVQRRRRSVATVVVALVAVVVGYVALAAGGNQAGGESHRIGPVSPTTSTGAPSPGH